jgi:DNA-binding SARP family transcriptional activator
MTVPDNQPALYLLGGIALRGIPQPEADAMLAQSKVVALLAYLALSTRGSFQRRDRIAGLLWPDLDQPHARAALRKVIHMARTTLGESAVIGRGDEELAFNHEAIWCDTVALQAAVERGHLGRAVELYADDGLMPGFYLTDCYDFDAWLSDKRAAMLESAVAASWALAQHLEATSNRTEAGKQARHTVRLAWSNERVLRRSLNMLNRLGDRAGALRQYEVFVRRLRKELEAEPSKETVELVEAIRNGTATP